MTRPRRAPRPGRDRGPDPARRTASASAADMPQSSAAHPARSATPRECPVRCGETRSAKSAMAESASSTSPATRFSRPPGSAASTWSQTGTVSSASSRPTGSSTTGAATAGSKARPERSLVVDLACSVPPISFWKAASRATCEMRSANGTCVPRRRRGPLPSQRSGRSAKSSRTERGTPSRSQRSSATSHIATMCTRWPRAAPGSRLTPCAARTIRDAVGSPRPRTMPRTVSCGRPKITGTKCVSSMPSSKSSALTSASAVQPR